jgi:Putative transposase of IS4/5 family (DUF4096)
VGPTPYGPMDLWTGASLIHPTTWKDRPKRVCWVVNRYSNSCMRKIYPTDLSDAEWACIEPHLPTPRAAGRPRIRPLRELLNAIFYIVRSGCPWRLLRPTSSRLGRPFIIISGFGASMAPGSGYTLPCASDYGSASRESLSRVLA